MDNTLIILVVIGALIGYITNYIAIKLLFRPYKPLKIGSLVIFPQGVIPREKANLARNVSNVVKSYLLSEEEVRKIFSNQVVKDEISTFLKSKITSFSEKNIDEFITKEELAAKLSEVIDNIIKEKFPMISNFISKSMLEKLILEVDVNVKIGDLVDNKKLIDYFETEIFQFLDKELPTLFIKADIDKVIEEKILQFNEKQLEEMLFSLMKKHFSFINFAGAFLGAVIGLIQYFIIKI